MQYKGTLILHCVDLGMYVCVILFCVFLHDVVHIRKCRFLQWVLQLLKVSKNIPILPEVFLTFVSKNYVGPSYQWTRGPRNMYMEHAESDTELLKSEQEQDHEICTNFKKPPPPTL